MPGTPQVVVVADSTVSLPQDLLERWGILTVPLELTINGRVYRDGVDISAENLYRMMPTLAEPPKTSAPRPEAFLEAFRQAAQRAPAVLCLTLASRLSATYYTALAAADLAKESFPHLRIQVLDTQTAGGGEALVALAAAERAWCGASLEEVAARAQMIIQRVHFLGVLETLYYLWKGGRIPKVALWATHLLSIKPILDIRHGEVHLVDRPRTKARAVERILTLIEERVGRGPLRVNIMHANAPDEAHTLRQRIENHFLCRQVLVTVFTPVIGAHTGPGLLGVAFYKDDIPQEDSHDR
ncbi:MAG: DegV family protein [Dehalococcoidia bacterium]|nr:DegV family protein [Dehalococcoidia bacterium]MDW8119141.1 DegV family protein [Chloroflexota bacterium]